MNKKMRELMAKIESKLAMAKSFKDGENKDMEGAAEKASKLYDEIDDLRKEYDLEEKAMKAEKLLIKDKADEAAEDMNKNPEDPAEKGQKGEVDSTKEFADAARKGFKSNKTMSEGVGVDGGYTVPEDIQTRIEKHKTAKSSMLDLVHVVKVKTNKGSRTFKKKSQQTGFSSVGEGGKIKAKGTPQFETIKYEIEKYGGYFPVTNELLRDSDAEIANTLIEWIGDESRVTGNVLIAGVLMEKAGVKLTGLDAIKKEINVTLGAAYSSAVCIVTNDHGLNYLDTLKDSTGRYLLSPDPGNPMKKRIAVGASFIPLEVMPKEDLPNYNVYSKTTDTSIKAGKTYYTVADEVYTAVASPVVGDIATYYEAETRTPFFLGDMKESVRFFDRQKTSIKVSDVAQVGDLNAFEQDLTLYRAIEREDVQAKDTDAWVNGYLVLGE